MTATTPIYGLSYPEGSDLVSTASASFKSMATTFEKALDEVDKRSSPEGVKPVVATDLETLVKTNGVQGQSGIVTNAAGRRVSTTCSATAGSRSRRERNADGTGICTRSDGQLQINPAATPD